VHAGGLSLPEAVFELLRARKETLSVAESCTGGGLGALITEIPGSSAVFERGYLTYSNPAKTDLLGVPGEVLGAYGAVSEETALAMAQGCLERSGATYACAITGIAGPDGGTPEKPVGTVWIAVASRAARHARRFHFRGDRQNVRRASALAALNQIRLFLLDAKA
jgi:PncC family amidohydrolase